MTRPSTVKFKENLRDEECLRAVNAAKLMAILVLRDKGYGLQRLMHFSNKFNEEFNKVMNDVVTLEDIQDIVQDETGITHVELRVK